MVGVTKFISLIALIATMILCIGLPVYADAPPSTPHQFYGTVTVNGVLAGQGTTVAAKIGGVIASQSTTDTQGRYGYSVQMFVSGQNGATIEFWVNGVKAQQTASLAAGAVTQLNLVVTGSSTPSTPTPVPAPQPTPTPTPVPSPAPSTPATGAASFAVGPLSLSASEAPVGQKIIVATTITNTGSRDGTYQAVLKVGGVDETKQDVNLAAGKSTQITFTVSRNTAGTYSIAVGTQAATLKVTGKQVATATTTNSREDIPVLPTILFVIVGIVAVIAVVVLFRKWNVGKY